MFFTSNKEELPNYIFFLYNKQYMDYTELSSFSLIFTFYSFIVSYITDLFNYKPINWFPPHGFDMATGTFLTAVLVYIVYVDKYIKKKDCEFIQ